MSVMLKQSTLFLVWGPPILGPRSQVFGRKLGIEELHFVYSTTKSGLLYAPVKYVVQAIQTLFLLFRKRPKIVFVQSPPSLAVLFVYIYCKLAGSHYLVDAHSGAFLPYWTHPRWLHHLLARNAITTIVTNEHLQGIVNQWGGRAFVLRDIPTIFPTAGDYPLNGDFNIVVVNSFGSDEPLREVLKAANDLDGISFYVTGRKKNAKADLLANLPDNVHFTDFLPNDQYYALMAASHSILCLTTRNNTMQRGACEALWMGKPIITSKWPLLQEYFCKGTVHVNNTRSGIRLGVLEMKEHYPRYVAEIQALQAARQQEWQEKIEALMDLINKTINQKQGEQK